MHWVWSTAHWALVFHAQMILHARLVEMVIALCDHVLRAPRGYVAYATVELARRLRRAIKLAVKGGAK